MTRTRIAHWPNGPQMHELRAILDTRKDIMKSKISSNLKIPKSYSPKTRTNPVITKPIPENNRKVKSQDELAREQAHFAKPLNTSSNCVGRQNGANIYRGNLPVDVRREAERLREISSVKPAAKCRVNPIRDKRI